MMRFGKCYPKIQKFSGFVLLLYILYLKKIYPNFYIPD